MKKLGGIQMTVLTKEDIQTRKRQLQKELKGKGYNLTYSKNNSEFKLYLQTEKGSTYIEFSWYQKTGYYASYPLNRMEVSLANDKQRKSPSIEKAIGALDVVIADFIDMQKEMGEKNYEITVRKGWSHTGEEVKMFNNHLREKWGLYLINTHRNPASYVNEESYEYYQKLVRTGEGYNEEYHKLMFNQELERRYEQFHLEDSYPKKMKYIFKDVVDKNVVVYMDFGSMDYRVTIESKYHKKESIFKDISKEIIDRELEDFTEEEKFKALLEGPTMNEAISRSLKVFIRDGHVRTDLKEEQLFEFFLDYFSVEEMNQNVKDYPHFKRYHSGRYEENEYDPDRFGEGRSCKLETNIYLYWNHYVTMTAKKVTKEEQVYDFFLHKNYEEAKKNEKKWVFENLELPELVEEENDY